jgi:hypothetical protein
VGKLAFCFGEFLKAFRAEAIDEFGFDISGLWFGKFELGAPAAIEIGTAAKPGSTRFAYFLYLERIGLFNHI